MNCPRCGAGEEARDDEFILFECHSHHQIGYSHDVDYVSQKCSERQVSQLKEVLEMAEIVLTQVHQGGYPRGIDVALAAIAKAKGTK